MPKVTIELPDAIHANILAILCENGAVSRIINEEAERVDITCGLTTLFKT